MMELDKIGNNPLFELVYEDEEVREGDMDDCRRFLSEREGANLFHMNTCSINSKYNALTTLFHGLNANLDVIILSEAHIKNIANIEQYNFGDYKMYGTENNVRKTDGILIYIKSSIPHEVQEIKLDDCNCMRIKYRQNNKQFLCHAFYRSPSGKTEKFLDQLEYILENEKEVADTKIITGDLNINILNTKDKQTDRYLNILAIHGYLSQLNRPTRIGKKTQSCLDHMFVKSKSGSDQSCFIIQTNVSDHYPVVLNVKTGKNTHYEKQHTIGNVKLDINNLTTELQSQEWEDVYNCENAENATDIFLDKLKNLINKNSKTTYKKVQKKIKPWVTEGLIISMKKETNCTRSVKINLLT